MKPLTLVSNSENSSEIASFTSGFTDKVRADSLDMMLCGQPLSDILADALTRAEAQLHLNHLSVYAVCPQTGDLLALAHPSLPLAFVQTISKAPLLSADAHIGQAYFTGHATYVDGFLLPSHLGELRRVAAHAQINRCLSLPLIGNSGETVGALDMYYSDDTDLLASQADSLQHFSNMLGLVLERGLLQDKKHRATQKLHQRIDEQQQSLTETHIMLTKALSQRDEVRAQLVEMEKMASMGTMVSSMTHEMNTPLGVSLTAITHLRKLQIESKQAFDEQTLRRSQLEKFYDYCDEACAIAERNLSRAASVVDIFKQLSVDQHSEDQRHINLSDLVCELLLSLKPELKRTDHVFCIGIDPSLSFYGQPGPLGQILVNLIMNSIKHAFRPSQRGRICLSATIESSLSGKVLELVYSDNGRGMDSYTRQNIYRPFFTLAKQSGGTGLGMHICYNLAVNSLNGSISCESELNKGTRFTLRFPISTT